MKKFRSGKYLKQVLFRRKLKVPPRHLLSKPKYLKQLAIRIMALKHQHSLPVPRIRIQILKCHDNPNRIHNKQMLFPFLTLELLGEITPLKAVIVLQIGLKFNRRLARSTLAFNHSFKTSLVGNSRLLLGNHKPLLMDKLFRTKICQKCQCLIKF